MTPSLARVLIDLDWLHAHALDVGVSRFPGTPKPWAQRDLDPERKAERSLEARAERLERSTLGLGEARAPLDVDASDLLIDLLATADTLAEAVTQLAGVERLPHAPSAHADPRPYLLAIRVHLEAAAEYDPGILDAAAYDCGRLRTAVTRLLRLRMDGQQLGACPWCRIERLRVRMLHGEPVVVCESGVCEPPESDCGVWVRGRPAWPEREWDFLANRIRHADEANGTSAA